MLQEIQSRVPVTDQGIAVLCAVNPTDWDELHALLATYPGLAEVDVPLPELSNLSAQQAGGVGLALSVNLVANQPVFLPQLGALQPSDGNLPQMGSTIPVPATTSSTMASTAISGARPIDWRLQNWQVRNQGQRGTCVAFAATACCEIKGGQHPLSEQFLYWAIKSHHDPNPNADGTELKCARNALNQDGICSAGFWPYFNAAMPAGQFQGGPQPSAAAIAAASQRKFNCIHQKNGAAAQIYASLAAGRSASISLPVFASSGNLGGPNNWTSAVGQTRGRVLNPPPTSVVVGGHAVCITGFVPDSTEPNGGHFVIRNSWDPRHWGFNGSPKDLRNPEPGYGSVSATYVQKYAWEWLNI